jgi:hypothetical protein
MMLVALGVILMPQNPSVAAHQKRSAPLVLKAIPPPHKFTQESVRFIPTEASVPSSSSDEVISAPTTDVPISSNDEASVGEDLPPTHYNAWEQMAKTAKTSVYQFATTSVLKWKWNHQWYPIHPMRCVPRDGNDTQTSSTPFCHPKTHRWEFDLTSSGKKPLPTTVIIDVGTNTSPDYLKVAQGDADILYIMVEPVTYLETRRHCDSFPERCIIFPSAALNAEKTVNFIVSSASVCSSLLANGTGCAVEARRIEINTISLATIIDWVPPSMKIRLVALDCQGTDLLSAASLFHTFPRVANVLLECQDLPLRHEKMISPLGYNCGQVMSCIQQHWKRFQFEGCWLNMGPEEYNCLFTNVRHPLKDPTLRPHFMANSVTKTKLIYPTECPSEFLRSS